MCLRIICASAAGSSRISSYAGYPIKAKLPKVGVPVMLERGEHGVITPQAWLEEAATLLCAPPVIVIPTDTCGAVQRRIKSQQRCALSSPLDSRASCTLPVRTRGTHADQCNRLFAIKFPLFPTTLISLTLSLDRRTCFCRVSRPAPSLCSGRYARLAGNVVIDLSRYSAPGVHKVIFFSPLWLTSSPCSRADWSSLPLWCRCSGRTFR